AMAPGAIEPCPGHMGAMMEIYKIGYPKDALPRYGPLRIIIGFHLPYLRMRGDNVFVAKETFFHFRNPGILGPFYKGMAEAAIDLFHPGMHAMTERDRLPGAYPACRIKSVE
ncbi:MAG: hypothetical protein ACYDHW_16345, partial [Syntrophorhabdaceae bacterium]